MLVRRGAGIPTLFAHPEPIQSRPPVECEHQKATGRDKACRLLDCCVHIAGMVQHAPGIDDIEAAVALGIQIEHADLFGLPRHGNLVTGQNGLGSRDAIGIDVERLDAGNAELGRRQRMQARAAADIEKRAATQLVDGHELQ